MDDSQRIGRGTRGLARLRKFSLTRSSLDQARAAAILQGLAVNLTVSTPSEEVTTVFRFCFSWKRVKFSLLRLQEPFFLVKLTIRQLTFLTLK